MTRMLSGIHYIGLSTEDKPDKDVKPGECFYEVDTKKSFIFYDGRWWDM